MVTLAPDHRAGLIRHAVQSTVFAVAAAILVAVLDQLLFDGVTATRTPALDAHPSPAARVAISFVGGLLEELVFRLFLATAVATIVWLALGRSVGHGPTSAAAAQWTGTIVAMVLVGVWHVSMVGDPNADPARVLAVNAVGNLLYGWTYWRRGFEMAVLTHGVLNSTLYLGLPLLH